MIGHAQFSNKFDDPHGILNKIWKDSSTFENLDNLFVLSNRFLNETSFKDFKNRFTVTEL